MGIEKISNRPTMEDKLYYFRQMAEGHAEDGDLEANIAELKEFADGKGEKETREEWYPGWTQEEFEKLLAKLAEEGIIETNREKNIENDISQCQSFDELYKIIKKLKHVEGSQKTYLSDELIKYIERVRHGHRNILFITRTHGIRDIVKKLLPADKIFKKYRAKPKAKYN